MTIIVGVTGGIASGKSTITNQFKYLKIPTHDSDKVVNELYNNPKKKFIEFLKKINLEKAIYKKNKINKKTISEEIFKNKLTKRKLEKFIHKKVKKERDLFLKKNLIKKNKMICLDIPLLFENKLEKICDYIITTYAPISIREKRALKRKNMTKKIFKMILKNQVKHKERKQKSNIILNTNQHKSKTLALLNQIIKDIIS